MIKQAGELRQVVDILRRVQGQTANGFPLAERYDRVATVRAKAEDATYREFYAAAAGNVRAGVNYYIRYRPDVVAGMYVQNLSTPGPRHRIVQVHHQGYGRKYLLLRCEQLEGVDK